MRLLQLTLVALVCATSFFNALAQSSGKYKVVFSTEASMKSFIAELNKSGAERYRLKTSTAGYQRLNGQPYYIAVGVAQADETEFEYASFELTSKVFFAISGFEAKYAEESRNGFYLVDHFLNNVDCEDSSDDVAHTMAICALTYQFLLEREKNASRPIDFVIAEDTPTFKRDPGRTLGSAIMEKWAQGFYPATVLTNYQILLAHTEDKTELRPEPLEVQVLNSSFMNHVKKKIKTLGRQGFRLSLIGRECAVMYRKPIEQEPVVYEWLNAKEKKLEKELARLHDCGAVFRMVYRDEYGGNQLVFERPANGARKHSEYRVLNLSFQLLNPPLRKGVFAENPRVDLTPEGKETQRLINELARQGFVVRDLFVSDVVSRSVSVLLER